MARSLQHVPHRTCLTCARPSGSKSSLVTTGDISIDMVNQLVTRGATLADGRAVIIWNSEATISNGGAGQNDIRASILNADGSLREVDGSDISSLKMGNCLRQLRLQCVHELAPGSGRSRVARSAAHRWMGVPDDVDAEAAVQATIGRMAWTSFTLHTGVEPRSATFREYRISVVGLRPSPRSDRRVAARDYVLTLKVE